MYIYNARRKQSWFFPRAAHDFYATDPIAASWLLILEPDLKNIWECTCGAGHLSKVFENAGIKTKSTDLVYRGYGTGETDFLKFLGVHNGDIVTNPPYKYALDFVKKALEVIPEGRKACFFLKLTFLEGKARKNFFIENPPKTVYVSSSRINCAPGGDFVNSQSSAVAYAWFIWQKGYKGDIIVKHFN